jgi:hypothetical protein
VVLSALATVADLAVRGVDITNTTRATTLLASASAAIRAAAGHPISSVTSTVGLEGRSSRWLHLPAGPVTAVSLVKVDDVAVTDWQLYPGGRLRRDPGLLWAPLGEPTVVTVTYSHGFATVDADIVDLACGLVAGALAAADAGYDPGIGVQSVRVDDASETYVTGSAARSGQMELTEATRDWLAARFGGGAYAVGAGTG